MELDDCAFPTLAGVEIGDDANRIFDGANVALLVGARPRSKGMERGDLLEANGAIFTAQGKALNDHAADDIRITVTGNPANTNALIAMSNAPDIPRERFSALTRLDHNRAIAQLAAEDRRQRQRDPQDDDLGQPLRDAVPRPLPRRGRRPQRRRGRRRPGLAGEHLHPDRAEARRGDHRGPRRVVGGLGARRPRSTTPATGWPAAPRAAGCRWRSCSDGSYGVPEGLISSFPVTTSNGDWEIVQGLEIDDFSRARIDASAAELAEERDAVKGLGLI